MIANTLIAKLADHALASSSLATVPNVHDPKASEVPLRRAQDRLARAQASAEALDSLEQSIIPMGVLSGIAFSLAGRR